MVLLLRGRRIRGRLLNRQSLCLRYDWEVLFAMSSRRRTRPRGERFVHIRLGPRATRRCVVLEFLRRVERGRKVGKRHHLRPPFGQGYRLSVLVARRRGLLLVGLPAATTNERGVVVIINPVRCRPLVRTTWRVVNAASGRVQSPKKAAVSRGGRQFGAASCIFLSGGCHGLLKSRPGRSGDDMKFCVCICSAGQEQPFERIDIHRCPGSTSLARLALGFIASWRRVSGALLDCFQRPRKWIRDASRARWSRAIHARSNVGGVGL